MKTKFALLGLITIFALESFANGPRLTRRSTDNCLQHFDLTPVVADVTDFGYDLITHPTFSQLPRSDGFFRHTPRELDRQKWVPTPRDYDFRPDVVALSQIHFMQLRAGAVTTDLDHSVYQNALDLASGVLRVDQFPPVAVWQDQLGRVWTTDHRRIISLLLAGTNVDVPVRWLSPREVWPVARQMSTLDMGNTIVVEHIDSTGVVVQRSTELRNIRRDRREIQSLSASYDLPRLPGALGLEDLAFVDMMYRQNLPLQDGTGLYTLGSVIHTASVAPPSLTSLSSADIRFSVDSVPLTQEQLRIAVEEARADEMMFERPFRVWQDRSGRVWTLDNERLALLALSGRQVEVPVEWVTPPRNHRVTSQTDGNTIAVELPRTEVALVVSRRTDFASGLDGSMIDGTAIAPNEYRPDIFANFLAGKSGAFVSIGGFRTLFASAKANFSRVISVDIDQAIPSFMKMTSQLSEIARSPREFLTLLALGRRLTTAEAAMNDSVFVESVAGAFPNGHFIERLMNLGISLEPSEWNSLRRANLENVIFSFFDDSANPHGARAVLNNLISNGTLDETSFGSQRVFAAIRELFRGGRFSAVLLNLAGEAGMIRLARDLRDRQEALTALDLSNAIWHIARGSRDLGPLRNLVRNVDAFTWSDGGHVLLTSKGGFGPDGPSPSALDYWTYYAIPVEDFKRLLNAAIAAGGDPVAVVRRFEASIPNGFVLHRPNASGG